MLSEKKHYFSVCVILVALMNAVRFSIFYLPNYVFEPSEAWSYIIRFSGLVFDMLLPALIAVECFFSLGCEKLGRVAMRAGILTLTTVIYNFPYYYLYALSLQSDSATGVLWGLGAAVVLTLTGTLHAVLLYAVLRFVAMQTVAESVRGRMPKLFSADIPKELRGEWNAQLWREVAARMDEGGIFSFESPAPFGILCICACQFVYRLAVELYNVIDYLVSYAGSYRTGEIVYMIFSLLFVVIMLFVCHAVCYFVGRFIRFMAKSKE